MPARKPHRKSRKGCVQCKKRHIKCGEERPKCLNCIEYEIQCLFLPNTSSALREALEAATTNSSALLNDVAKTAIPGGMGRNQLAASEDLNVSDLELIHFFTTTTYATMSNVPVEQELWRTMLVTTGLKHNFLLRGILAQAAVHLSYLKSPSEAISYLIKASVHQDLAISQFRKALETINESTFDAVLAFSCLLPIHSIALAACAITRPQLQENEQDSLSEFLKAMELIRSVRKILLPSLSVFPTSTILPLLQIVTHHLPEAETYPGKSSLDLLENTCCRYSRHQSLEAVDEGNGEAVPDRKELLSDTTNKLRMTFARVAHPKNIEHFTIGIILLWTIHLQEGYMRLVDQRDTAAMAVLAHFAALLCRYDNIWWLGGLGSSMIGIIGTMMSDEWAEVMEWPNAVAEQVKRQRVMG